MSTNQELVFQMFRQLPIEQQVELSEHINDYTRDFRGHATIVPGVEEFNDSFEDDEDEEDDNPDE